MTKKLSTDQGRLLLRVAREAVQSALAGQPLPELSLASYSGPLREKGASFVTLTLDGMLRGCVGSIEATDPLLVDVQQRALGAAFHDPRFPRVTADEYSRLRFEVSCLTAPERLDYRSAKELAGKIRPGVDGVILKHQFRRATFLPQVWEQLPDPELFLGRLCQKMGLHPQAWRELPLEVEIYQVEKFSEPD